jgi:hypothetical protein
MNEFAKTYSLMTDGELLRLSQDCGEIQPVARVALAQELYRRASEPRQADRGKSGREIVEVPRRLGKILFPEMCPSCLRTGVASDVAFQSLSHSKFRFAYTRHDYLSIKVPHCDQCAELLKRRRKQVTAYLIFVGILSFGLGIWFDWYRWVPFVLFFVLSLPTVPLISSAESVSLGDYDEEFLDFTFRNRQYADAFKRINGLSDADVAAERKSIFLKAFNETSGKK